MYRNGQPMNRKTHAPIVSRVNSARKKKKTIRSPVSSHNYTKSPRKSPERIRTPGRTRRYKEKNDIEVTSPMKIRTPRGGGTKLPVRDITENPNSHEYLPFSLEMDLPFDSKVMVFIDGDQIFPIDLDNVIENGEDVHCCVVVGPQWEARRKHFIRRPYITYIRPNSYEKDSVDTVITMLATRYYLSTHKPFYIITNDHFASAVVNNLTHTRKLSGENVEAYVLKNNQSLVVDLVRKFDLSYTNEIKEFQKSLKAMIREYGNFHLSNYIIASKIKQPPISRVELANTLPCHLHSELRDYYNQLAELRSLLLSKKLPVHINELNFPLDSIVREHFGVEDVGQLIFIECVQEYLHVSIFTDYVYPRRLKNDYEEVIYRQRLKDYISKYNVTIEELVDSYPEYDLNVGRVNSWLRGDKNRYHPAIELTHTVVNS